MRRGALVFASALALLVAVPSAGASRVRLVYRVDRLSAYIQGNKMIVDASGAVSTGGWSHARLRAKPSLPEAHVLALEFVASPPSAKKVVIQVLLPVKAQLKTGLPHYGTVAVSVIAQTNEITTEIRH